MIYWELFLGFLKVGCFSFGGGYGAIPLIREVVLSQGWLEEETLSYMIAVSESTPGPIMVNMATYIGSSQGGLPGAFLATLAVILPAFCIILLAMVLLNAALRSPWTQAVLGGVKPCVTGIILATGLYMILTNLAPEAAPDWRAAAITVLLAALLFGSKALFRRKLSPIALIVISAGLGILVYGI